MKSKNEICVMAYDLLNGIDAPLFRAQRLALSDAIGDREDNDLAGLENLCDHIADFLADELGKPECLLTKDDDE